MGSVPGWLKPLLRLKSPLNPVFLPPWLGFGPWAEAGAHLHHLALASTGGRC